MAFVASLFSKQGVLALHVCLKQEFAHCSAVFSAVSVPPVVYLDHDLYTSLLRLPETVPTHPLSQMSLDVWKCALLPICWPADVGCEHAPFMEEGVRVHHFRQRLLKCMRRELPRCMSGSRVFPGIALACKNDFVKTLQKHPLLQHFKLDSGSSLQAA